MSKVALFVLVLLAVASTADAQRIRMRIIKPTPEPAPQARLFTKAAPVSVPEPSTMLMFGLSAGAMALRRIIGSAKS